MGTRRQSKVGKSTLSAFSYRRNCTDLHFRNRENASSILDDYLASIGGRDKLYEDPSIAMKGKKRGRPSSSTPSATGKRLKKTGEHPADTEMPATAKAVTWKPPAGSWEHEVAALDACEDEDSGKLMVYLTWKNGYKTQHETSVVYKHCPQKVKPPGASDAIQGGKLTSFSSDAPILRAPRTDHQEPLGQDLQPERN